MVFKTSIQITLFGFISGFCLLLSGNTLNFWLAESGVDLITLGLFSLVALPYSLKYFIALFTNKIMPSLRSWLLIGQTLVLGTLVGLSQLNPLRNKYEIAVLTIALAFGSVIQDIYLDKLRIDKTQTTNNGHSAGGYIIGYRLGMLSSGAGLIFLSSLIEWDRVFFVACGLFLIICVAIHLSIPRKIYQPRFKKTRANFKLEVIRPILKIAKGKQLVYVISLIVLYRLADNLLAVLVNPFQLQLGFNAAEIATASKFFGTTMAIVGGIIGGKLLQRSGTSRALYYFALIHLVTHVLFIVQAKIGYNLPFLYLVNGAESLTGSMAMVAYIAYITGLCNKRHGTTQYALLSSIMGLSRTLLPASAGTIASYFSWEVSFILIFLTGVPSVILSAPSFRRKLQNLP